MSEPGMSPDARVGQSVSDGRARLDEQREWNGASTMPPTMPSITPPATSADAPSPFSALEQTQPRLATPPPHRANAPQNTGGNDGRDTRKRKRITDSARMPALRLNRRERTRRVEQKPPAVYDTEHAPGYLRVGRLGAGLALLAVAWGVSLLVIYLAEALWGVAPHQPVLTERFALYLLDAVGILWLAIVALALILVGAFSLFLALTRRRW